MGLLRGCNVTNGCVSPPPQVAVGQAFEELVLKILESPALVESSGSLAPSGVRLHNVAAGGNGGACSC